MLKRGKNKRSQVTVFIIIAAIIIGMAVTTFVFRNKINFPGTGNSNNFNPEINQIDFAIEECAKQRAVDAIRIIGLQGGYINLPDNYLSTDISNIAYGSYNGKNILASKSTIEKEISYYVELTMPFCLENEFQGFNITKSKATASTKINPDSVFVSIKMPISANKDEQTFTIDRTHNVLIPIKLGNMIDISNEIIKKEMDDPNNIDLTYLGNSQYYIIFSPINKQTIVYSITDENVEDIPYTFVFANKIK